MKKLLMGVVLILSLVFTVGLAGCTDSVNVQAADLSKGVKPTQVSVDVDLNGEGAVAFTDFAVRLANNSLPADGNMLISPLSVLSALAMTANGAGGETLAQMESVFGMTTDQINAYLRTYTDSLPQAKNYKLSLADSIWFTNDDSFSVQQDFLQANADWYGADIYQATFDDSTLKDINKWVKARTDGMIPEILDQFPENVVMYLINALAFDAQWQEQYKENKVREGNFTCEDGTVQPVEFMYSEETDYLEDENAVGFLKYYKEGKYAFAALLPQEGMSVEDYLASLDGETLHRLLSQPADVKVAAAIPKFKSEYTVEMRDILYNMGLTDAFDYTVSDFSGIGSSSEGNLYINRVLHKTFIAVDENGTKAGAATAVEIMEKISETSGGIQSVYLDRPFVYMLIDCEAHLPVFIGTTMTVAY